MSEVDQVEEPGTQEVTRRVVVSQTKDPLVSWLGWAIALLVLMLGALAVYAVVTGVFTNTTPRTAEEAELTASAIALRENPKNGALYSRRAEALFKMGRTKEAYEVLDVGSRRWATRCRPCCSS